MDTIDCPKCEHEHIPSGSHEDDSGEMECEECGFRFVVHVEYDPSYSTTCVDHEFGEFADYEMRSGETVNCRVCKHCQRAEIRQ